jgi:hypothetical protein
MFLAARSSLLASRQLSRYFSSSRPFQILGLQQIAVGSLTKEPLTELWQDVFGLTKVKTFVSESENVDEDILMLGDKNPLYAVEVDLMTPVDAEKSPKVNGQKHGSSRPGFRCLAMPCLTPSLFHSQTRYIRQL